MGCTCTWLLPSEGEGEGGEEAHTHTHTHTVLKLAVPWAGLGMAEGQAHWDQLKLDAAAKQAAAKSVTVAVEATTKAAEAAVEAAAACADHWALFDESRKALVALEGGEEAEALPMAAWSDELCETLSSLLTLMEAAVLPPPELPTIRKELQCYVTHDSAVEDVLGFGLTVNHHGQSRDIKDISSPCELLSQTAWKEHGVRESSYRQRLDTWIPLYIDPAHALRGAAALREAFLHIGGPQKGKGAVAQEAQQAQEEAVVWEYEDSHKGSCNWRALGAEAHRALEAAIAAGEGKATYSVNLRREQFCYVVDLKRMSQRNTQTGKVRGLRRSEHGWEECVLTALPKLLNSMVIDLAKGDVCATSLRLLNGFCQLHRLFLHLIDTHPRLKALVDRRLHDFVNGETSKDSCPNLGEWLVLLSVSEAFTWEEVAPRYLKESSARNVRWYARGKPALVSGELLAPATRAAMVFESTRVSRGLLCFSVFFLRTVARPPNHTLAQVSRDLDRRLGQPAPQTLEALQAAAVQIRAISSWAEYFSWIRQPEPHAADLDEQLRAAVQASADKGYHRPAARDKGGHRGRRRGGGGGRGGGFGRGGRGGRDGGGGGGFGRGGGGGAFGRGGGGGGGW
eukprot:COSAG06_NODE_3432_length_5355_cov_9.890982_6_plen_624_part_00